VTAIAERYANKWGLQVKSIRITGAKKRWGSCSQQNSLNFSLRLAMVPPETLEYVVVHELAHLHQPHHTPEFWQRVERALPDFERRKIWLAEHGMDVEGI